MKALAALLFLAVINDGFAHEKHEHPAPDKAPAQVSIRLADVALVDQDGSARRLPELVGDRIVVVDFVYTTCTTVCPVVSGILGQLQDKLGERLGPEVRLLSLSVDPLRDNPQRLKAYAAKHRAGAGWVWLTGQRAKVSEALKGFGAYTPDFADHPSVILVGDGKSGEWTRFYGFPNPDALLARIDALAAARLAKR